MDGRQRIAWRGDYEEVIFLQTIVKLSAQAMRQGVFLSEKEINAYAGKKILWTVTLIRRFTCRLIMFLKVHA